MRWRKYYVITQNLVIDLCKEHSLDRHLRDFSMPPKALALQIQNNTVFQSNTVSNGQEDGGNRSEQWALRYGINYQQNKQT